jgi:hypothetical protein
MSIKSDNYTGNYTQLGDTSRKVAVSIPDGVIAIFQWLNPSGCTMALGSTQPLKEMSTSDISWVGKGGRWVGLTTLTHSRADCLVIWELQPPGTHGACPGLYRSSFTFLRRIRANSSARISSEICWLICRDENFSINSDMEEWNTHVIPNMFFHSLIVFRDNQS